MDETATSLLRIEDVSHGQPCGVIPLEVGFSPDGRLLSFLYPDKRGLHQLHSVDLMSQDKTIQVISDLDTRSTLSLDEQLRRERMRLFTSGLTSYQWDESSGPNTEKPRRIMVPIDGHIVIFEESTSSTANKMEFNANIVYHGLWKDSLDILPAQAPVLSPDGKKIAFVVEDDIYLLYLHDTRHVVRVTRDGEREGVTCGLPDFLAQEEMDRYEGMWWSPDSKHLAFTTVDESHIPLFSIKHMDDDDPHKVESHRYPFAGKENPLVTLSLVAIPESVAINGSDDSNGRLSVHSDLSNNIILLDLLANSSRESWRNNYYITRCGWFPDNSVHVQVQNRSQDSLHLLRIDPSRPDAVATLIEENSKDYVSLHELLQATIVDETTLKILWGSERSGYQQLYLYLFDKASGVCSILNNGNPIGDGKNWVAESVVAVDWINSFVYVSGNCNHPCDKDLVRLSMTNPNDIVLCGYPVRGWHNSSISLEARVCVDIFSSLNHHPRMVISPIPDPSYSCEKILSMSDDDEGNIPFWTKKADCREIMDSISFNPTRNMRLLRHLDPITIYSIRSGDGAVDLFYSIRMKSNTMKPLPAIVSVYGGPHVQYCSNQWVHRASLREQYYVDQGYVVIRIDNRGSDRRGHAFEAAIYKNMGSIEVDDYVTVVNHLKQQGIIDGNRVGIIGWSYGGYISLMALTKASHVFSCAVSGAPVTSWDGYDTYYTEKYMSLPQSNPIGYENSRVMTHVRHMEGKLLLVHGLIDENVHFRHTARLINALITANKSYDILLLPNERHGPREPQTRQFLEKQLIGFFRKHIPPHHDELLKANETIPDELVGEYAASHEAANDYDANDRPSPPKAHL